MKGTRDIQEPESQCPVHNKHAQPHGGNSLLLRLAIYGVGSAQEA